MVEQNHLADMEWVDIVSEDNEVIAQSSRAQMRAERLRHRATYIVVHDGMGKSWCSVAPISKTLCRACSTPPQAA